MSKAPYTSSTRPSRKNYCAAKKCSGHVQQSCPLSFHNRYNARGDAAGFVDKNGSQATTGTGSFYWRQFGAWGDHNNGADNVGYYNWNAAWGYMQFPTSLNFDVHDGLDMGLYFVHGRWNNQDTGLYLSPNEKGDYLYGGDGQDPVNKSWDSTLARPNLPGDKRMATAKYLPKIKKQASIFGVPWQVLAGVLESEIKLDTEPIDQLEDIVITLFPDIAEVRDVGPGIGNIHISTAREVLRYVNTLDCGACKDSLLSDLNPSNAAIAVGLAVFDDYSIGMMAGDIRYLADFRFGINGQPVVRDHSNLGEWTLADAVAMWHGYRYGIPDITPQGAGFNTLADFQDRSLGVYEFIARKVVGKGNPKQSAKDSIPYFQFYGIRNP